MSKRLLALVENCQFHFSKQPDAFLGRFLIQIPSFLIQNSSFLIQIPSFLIQNSSLLIQTGPTRTPRPLCVHKQSLSNLPKTSPCGIAQCVANFVWPIFSTVFQIDNTALTVPILYVQECALCTDAAVSSGSSIVTSCPPVLTSNLCKKDPWKSLSRNLPGNHSPEITLQKPPWKTSVCVTWFEDDDGGLKNDFLLKLR